MSNALTEKVLLVKLIDALSPESLADVGEKDPALICELADWMFLLGNGIDPSTMSPTPVPAVIEHPPQRGEEKNG